MDEENRKKLEQFWRRQLWLGLAAVAKWQIRLELAYEIITLIWAFHIQIRIDDRTLPPGGNRSAK